MNKLLTLLCMFSFIYIIFNNIKMRKKIIIKSIFRTREKYITAVSIIIILMVSFVYGKNIWHYIFSFAAIMTFISAIVVDGITEEGSLYLRGRGLKVMEFPYDRIRLIKLTEDKGIIKFQSQGDGEIIIKYFKPEDLSSLKEVFFKNKIPVEEK